MLIVPEQRSDQDWVTRLAAADGQREPALQELRCVLASGLSRAYGPDSPLIEDAVQEALLRITAKLPTFRGDCPFVTWALSIANRIALSELRRARWKDVSLDDVAEASQLPAAVADMSSSYDRAQLFAVVQHAVESHLTAKQRTVVLAELSGMPPEEIARRLNTNRNALYKLVFDARVRLKQAILAAGWTLEHVRLVLGEGANRV